MSITHMALGYKWKFSTATEREVYMALADHADGEGKNIRPAVAFVAWKIDIDERTVRRNIKKLMDKGILVCQENNSKKGRPNLYRIDVSKGVEKVAYVAATDGQNVLPPITREMSYPVGHNDVLPGSGTMMSYKPSDKPSYKPSDNTLAANAAGDVIQIPAEASPLKQELESPPKISAAPPPTPKPAQPHIAIIDAWHAAIPPEHRPDGPPAYTRNVATSKVLVTAGRTPAQVAAFVRDKYPEYLSWAKNTVMPLEYVKTNLNSYLNGGNNGNNEIGRRGVPGATGSHQGVAANDAGSAQRGNAGGNSATVSRVPVGAHSKLKGMP